MRGGKRKGSGRPAGTTKTPTKVMRIPIPLVETILQLIADFRK